MDVMGKDPAKATVKCPMCNGKGVMGRTFLLSGMCAYCNGTGVVMNLDDARKKLVARVTLEFKPSSDPPNTNRIVLCATEEGVFAGWYQAKGRCMCFPTWYDCTAREAEGVKAWAELPEPSECIPVNESIQFEGE